MAVFFLSDRMLAEGSGTADIVHWNSKPKAWKDEKNTKLDTSNVFSPIPIYRASSAFDNGRKTTPSVTDSLN